MKKFNNNLKGAKMIKDIIKILNFNDLNKQTKFSNNYILLLTAIDKSRKEMRKEEILILYLRNLSSFLHFFYTPILIIG